MTTPAIIDLEPLEKRAVSLPEQARAVAILDQPSYDGAVELLRGTVALTDEIKRHYAPLKQKAHEAHKAVCAAEAMLLQPPSEAATILKHVIATWDQEQERKRREEQQRLEAEQRRQMEEAQLAAAVEAEGLGATQEDVDAILAEQPPIVALQAPPTYERAAGISARETYSAEVVNLSLLLRAVVEGKAPLQAIQANQVFLNAQARALKTAMQYPGVRLVLTRGTAVRR